MPSGMPSWRGELRKKISRTPWAVATTPFSPVGGREAVIRVSYLAAGASRYALMSTADTATEQKIREWERGEKATPEQWAELQRLCGVSPMTMKRLVVAVVMMLLVGPVFAQTPAPEPAPEVTALKAQIAELQKRLAGVEQKTAPTPKEAGKVRRAAYYAACREQGLAFVHAEINFATNVIVVTCQ